MVTRTKSRPSAPIARRSSPPVRPTLPPLLRVRHVRPHPLAVEHPVVDPVAHPEIPLHHPRDAREPQHAAIGLPSSSAHPTPPPHLVVQVQQAGPVHVAAEDPLADEQQVVVPLPRPVREEQVLADPVHPAGPVTVASCATVRQSRCVR